MIERDLVDFIHTSIRSVWTLELLLCLRRSPGRIWTDAELVREMRASDLIVSEGLSTLRTVGLVRPEEGGHRYAPASAVIAGLVDRLERLYRDRPVAVTKAIFAAPNERLKTFADAFRFRKDR